MASECRISTSLETHSIVKTVEIQITYHFDDVVALDQI